MHRKKCDMYEHDVHGTSIQSAATISKMNFKKLHTFCVENFFMQLTYYHDYTFMYAYIIVCKQIINNVFGLVKYFRDVVEI